ncbi:hypothetical protein MMC20_006813 [Loxospora ochrophaea]|nr:hypothetical protein [Loxospora ochrophaea]
MAFRQPTFAPPKPVSVSIPEQSLPRDLPSTLDTPVRDSQEWVLFSPTHPPSATQTYTTSTQRTPRTAGLSRLSDFGSLDTAARSSQEEERSDAAESAVEDDEELDSLDDGLHAFREPSIYQNSRQLDTGGNSILPVHDGLGSFPASSRPVQEQLWTFEQYNPRRRQAHHRRRSSVQRRLDAVDEHDSFGENERTQRIERWRLEQSKFLLDQIEKETRRRMSFSQRAHSDVDIASISGKPSLEPVRKAPSQEPEGNETFWQRLTRQVIQDLMGIDDSVLSVIFGESLPEENLSSRRAKSEQSLNTLAQSVDLRWEKRLLNRLARELGLLVRQFSENPRSLATYTNTSMFDYAGIPVAHGSILETSTKKAAMEDTGVDTTVSPRFRPTLQDRQPSTSASVSNHAALWGIEEEEPQELPYLENTPDLKTVFRFLRRLFTSSRRPASPKSNVAMSNSPESLRRAAIIRQHHPLVARAASYDRPSSVLSAKRPGSSCASMSTKKSKRDSGSSRNFWDIGGSCGSGSIGASHIMGAWGEV